MNMPNTRLLPVFILLLCAQLNFAQTGQVLFPGLSGAVLLDSVVAHYKTDIVLVFQSQVIQVGLGGVFAGSQSEALRG